MRRIFAFTVIGAAVLVSAWLIGSKVAQARRDAAYRTAIATFQRDLPIGTPKEEVRKYLNLRNVQYYAATRGANRVEAFEIKVGEDPSSLWCKPWDVYVALEFSSTDVLKQIHMRRSTPCL